MSLADADVVEALVAGALDGMSKQVPHADVDELLSAAFTLTQRVVHAVLKKPHAKPELIRQAIELLMLNTIGPRETKQ